MRRLLAVFAVVMFFATACGDDGGSATDAGPDDTASGQPDGIEPSDTAGDDPADDGTDDPADDGTDGPDGAVDCAEVEAALTAAGSIQGDPSATSPDDLQAEFEQSRAQLDALGDQVPELRADADDALAGLDKLGEAFESIGWDQTGFAANPEAAIEFAQLLGDADVMGMTTAMGNISTWMSTECTG